MENVMPDAVVGRAGFLDIPLELRWQIYGYLLRPGDRLIVEDALLANWSSRRQAEPGRTVYMFRQLSSRLRLGSSSAQTTYNRCHAAERFRDGRPLKICTKVLVLNRQIRDEALPFLYGQHLRFACSPDGVQAFLDDRPDAVLQLIKHITLAVPSETGRMKFKSLCSFIARKLQLRSLDVRISTFWWEVNPFESVHDGTCALTSLLTLDWVGSLLLIGNLDSLTVHCNDRFAMLGLTTGTDFMELLQARMVTSGVHNRARRKDSLEELS
ncbi:MAG: hypothetical protein LQ345_001624 [Seirophora villosa]|nr:MAG: hypothetical protein LQ345_001624 [Seirophora villosa]